MTGDIPRRSLYTERDLENVSRSIWQRPGSVLMIDEQTVLVPESGPGPLTPVLARLGGQLHLLEVFSSAGVLRDRVWGSLDPLRLDRPAPARAILALPDLVGRVTGRTLPDPGGILFISFFFLIFLSLPTPFPGLFSKLSVLLHALCKNLKKYRKH